MNNDKFYQQLLDKATIRYSPEAVERTRQELCSECPDKPCPKEPVCHTFNLLYRSYLWELAGKAAILN